MELKIKGTMQYSANMSNVLPQPADSNGLIVVELRKRS